MWGLYLLIIIDATHFEENWTFLEGGENHNISFENDYVLDFIVKPLDDPTLLFNLNNLKWILKILSH